MPGCYGVTSLREVAVMVVPECPSSNETPLAKLQLKLAPAFVHDRPTLSTKPAFDVPRCEILKEPKICRFRRAGHLYQGPNAAQFLKTITKGTMFQTMRSKAVSLSVATVIAELFINTGTCFPITQYHSEQAIEEDLDALEHDHVSNIGEWACFHALMTESLQGIALTPDRVPYLNIAADGGGFSNVCIGCNDKIARFSDPRGIPSDYDQTGRPWYRQTGCYPTVHRSCDLEASGGCICHARCCFGTGPLCHWRLRRDEQRHEEHTVYPSDALQFRRPRGQKGNVVAHLAPSLTMKPLRLRLYDQR